MAQAEEIRTETGPLDYDYTEKEVELCQENLQNHKACSPDKIKNEMLNSLGVSSALLRINGWLRIIVSVKDAVIPLKPLLLLRPTSSDSCSRMKSLGDDELDPLGLHKTPTNSSPLSDSPLDKLPLVFSKQNIIDSNEEESDRRVTERARGNDGFDNITSISSPVVLSSSLSAPASFANNLSNEEVTTSELKLSGWTSLEIFETNIAQQDDNEESKETKMQMPRQRRDRRGNTMRPSPSNPDFSRYQESQHDSALRLFVRPEKVSAFETFGNLSGRLDHNSLFLKEKAAGSKGDRILTWQGTLVQSGLELPVQVYQCFRKTQRLDRTQVGLTHEHPENGGVQSRLRRRTMISIATNLSPEEEVAEDSETTIKVSWDERIQEAIQCWHTVSHAAFHPHVARFLGHCFGSDRNGYESVLLVEDCAGFGQLASLLREGTETRARLLAAESLMAMVVDSLRGLRSLHSSNVIHGCISPKIFFLGRTGKVVLSDLSRVRWSKHGIQEPGEADKTWTWESTQQDDYGDDFLRPPNEGEQLSPNKKTDLWMFGAAWLQLLVGTSLSLVETTSSSLLELAASSLPLSTPGILGTVLRLCLQPQPTSRPDTEDLWQMLGSGALTELHDLHPCLAALCSPGLATPLARLPAPVSAQRMAQVARREPTMAWLELKSPVQGQDTRAAMRGQEGKHKLKNWLVCDVQRPLGLNLSEDLKVLNIDVGHGADKWNRATAALPDQQIRPQDRLAAIELRPGQWMDLEDKTWPFLKALFISNPGMPNPLRVRLERGPDRAGHSQAPTSQAKAHTVRDYAVLLGAPVGLQWDEDLTVKSIDPKRGAAMWNARSESCPISVGDKLTGILLPTPLGPRENSDLMPLSSLSVQVPLATHKKRSSALPASLTATSTDLISPSSAAIAASLAAPVSQITQSQPSKHDQACVLSLVLYASVKPRSRLEDALRLLADAAADSARVHVLRYPPKKTLQDLFRALEVDEALQSTPTKGQPSSTISAFDNLDSFYSSWSSLSSSIFPSRPRSTTTFTPFAAVGKESAKIPDKIEDEVCVQEIKGEDTDFHSFVAQVDLFQNYDPTAQACSEGASGEVAHADRSSFHPGSSARGGHAHSELERTQGSGPARSCL
eukprot:g3976.t1